VRARKHPGAVAAPWLGVDPARQRAGLGAELLTQCLAQVDEDHLPAFLETPNPPTIPFYERHLFEVTNIAQAGGESAALDRGCRSNAPVG
jgi:GNAT superfamily N-acetyltransferase